MNANIIEARMNLGRNFIDLTEACREAHAKLEKEEFKVEYFLNGKWHTRNCTNLENMEGFKNRVRELGGIC